MDHRELIVINGAEVLARAEERGAYWQRIRAGGATAFAATTGRAQLPAWFRRFRDDDTLLHVTEPRHIREAKGGRPARRHLPRAEAAARAGRRSG